MLSDHYKKKRAMTRLTRSNECNKSERTGKEEAIQLELIAESETGDDQPVFISEKGSQDVEDNGRQLAINSEQVKKTSKQTLANYSNVYFTPTIINCL